LAAAYDLTRSIDPSPTVVKLPLQQQFADRASAP